MKNNLPPRDLVLMAIILTIVLFVKAYKVDQSIQSEYEKPSEIIANMYK